MSFSLSVQKRLQSLKGAGYCEFVRACNGADSHSGSYRFFLDGCVLELFEGSMVLDFLDIKFDFFYSEISKLVSHLSVDIFSNASMVQDADFSVPLDIHVSDQIFTLNVRLLAYSRLLIVLSDLSKVRG